MRGALLVVSEVDQALPLIKLIVDTLVITLMAMGKQILKNDDTSYTRASSRPAGPS